MRQIKWYAAGSYNIYYSGVLKVEDNYTDSEIENTVSSIVAKKFAWVPTALYKYKWEEVEENR